MRPWAHFLTYEIRRYGAGFHPSDRLFNQRKTPLSASFLLYHPGWIYNITVRVKRSSLQTINLRADNILAAGAKIDAKSHRRNPPEATHHTEAPPLLVETQLPVLVHQPPSPGAHSASAHWYPSKSQNNRRRQRHPEYPIKRYPPPSSPPGHQ